MKNTKKVSKNQLKKDRNKNIIFIAVILLVLIVIIVLSFNLNNKSSNIKLPFSSSEFKNISVIGIQEYQASLNFDGTSIILFCNNEVKACYDELKELDKIAEEHKIIIEYVNVAELVESEKTELSAITNIFDDDYYPNLIIINNKNILNNSNEYLTGNEIEDLLKKHEIIK